MEHATELLISSQEFVPRTSLSENILGWYDEYIYLLFIFIGLSLIVYAIKLHFDIYDSQIIAVKAIITNIECSPHIINRRRNTYTCKINIRYKINNRIIDNIIVTNGTQIHHEGDEAVVYVDRENPVNISTPYISDTILTIVLSTLGLLIILIVLSTLSTLSIKNLFYS